MGWSHEQLRDWMALALNELLDAQPQMITVNDQLRARGLYTLTILLRDEPQSADWGPDAPTEDLP